MKSTFSFCALLFVCGIANAQLSFSPVTEPAPSFNLDDWTFLSDGHGQLYFKEWDDFYNPQFNRYLLHSGDGGTHWSIVSHKAGRRHFVGLDGMVYLVEGQSLQRSEDHGLNFDTIALNIPAARHLIAFENGDLYVLNNNGIYTSTNQGTDWTQVSNVQISVLSNLPGHPDLWGWNFVDNVFHFWHSPAGGQNWSEVYSQAVSNYNSSKTRLLTSLDGMLYLQLGDDRTTILRSTDSGATWEKTQVKPNTQSLLKALAVFPSGELMAYLQDHKWYRSTDQGQNWQQFTPTWGSQFQIAKSTPEGDVFAAGATYLSKYNANGGWDFAAFGLTTPFQILWPDAATIQMLTSGGVINLENGQSTFIPFNNLDIFGNCSQIYLVKPDEYYLKQCDKTLLHTIDFGLHHDTIFNTDDLVNSGEFITHFQHNGDTLRLFSYNYLYTSFDAGASWSYSAFIPGFNSWSGMTASSSGRVYAYSGGRISRSDDNGATLVPVFSGACCFTSMQCIDDDYVYAMHDKEMWVSIDHAQHWERLGTDPLNGNWAFDYTLINNFKVMPDQRVFAAGKWNGVGSVFYSPDHGQSWEIYEVGPGNCTIKGFGRDGRLYVSLSGSIVDTYTLLRSNEQLVSTEEKAPNSTLLKIYPNPANDLLFFDSGYEEDFSGQIFDLAGHLVQSFSKGASAKGLDISNLPNGVYLVEISLDHQIQHAKFIKVQN